MDIVNDIIRIEGKEIGSIRRDSELLNAVCDWGMSVQSILTNSQKSELMRGMQYNPNEYGNMILEILPKISSYREVDGKIINGRDVVFDKLKEFGFNESNEIKMAIRTIGRTPNFSSYDAYRLENSNHCGYKTIKTIEFDYTQGLYTIYDFNGETYSFYKADYYFRDYPALLEYIEANGNENNCHVYAEHLQSFFPEGESITAYCQRFMNDNYYAHSYVSLNGMIIDLNLNIVMDEETYYKLMQPTELVRIKNSDVDKYKIFVENLLNYCSNKMLVEDRYFMLLLGEISQVLPNYPDLYQEFLSLSDSPRRN